MLGARQLKLFSESRLNEDLLKCSPFVEALHLVEATVVNPHLSVKFSQTCIASLRNEQLYDLEESRRHTCQIYSHLVTVLQNISFELDDFEDKWSSFTVGSKTKSSFDKITFDAAVIRGASMPDDHVDARLIFFFYAKLLHEVAHASLAELGRKLPSGDYDDRFSSPATHAMTGEAGDAIERHFFGSVTDARGHYTNEEESIYKIEHVVLRERRSKQRVTDEYLRNFIGMNLFLLESIPLVETEKLDIPLTSRKRKRHLPSTPTQPAQRRSLARNTIIETPMSIHRWGWGPEADVDSDEEVKELFDCNGKRRLPCIWWKE